MAFPGTYDFDYYRGDTFVFKITPKTSTGATFDLAAYASAPATTVFTISTSRGDNPTTKISNTANDSMLSATTDGGTDIITCTIKPGARTVLVGGSTYYYDVEIYNGASLRYTLLTGAITVTDDVTGTLGNHLA
jgi:hypothetical protein